MVERVAGVYVALVAFLTGASVMIVELTASRILSPHFGNTLFTWTSLIGVIMVALAGGYYAGGRLADYAPRPLVLLHLVSAAALSVLMVPFLALQVMESLAPEGQPTDLIWGPLTAALLLFAIPGCLLGTVTPFAIKLLSLRSENQRVGTSAGTVSMLSTLGSVLGTFGAGFVLIPAFSLTTIFVVVGATLGLVAALGYAGFLGSRARSFPAAALVAAGILLGTLLARASGEPEGRNVIFRADTYYHRIEVRRWRERGQWILEVLMDGAPQGAQYEDGGRLRHGYAKFYRLERVFCPALKRALFLGGGAFSMPEALSDDHEDAAVEVVELDPVVTEVGRRFFRLDEYAGRISPHTGDARAFLRHTPQRYDLIFGDAYHGRQNVPAHMLTREFFELVRRRLNDQGVYMMNLIGAVEGDSSRVLAAVGKTLLEVFPEFYVFAAHPAHRELTQNLILVAPVRELGYDRDELIARAGDDEALARMVRNLVPRRTYDFSAATVLTDDYNPIEYLVAQQLRASH